jgi:hypothetical protein
MTLRRGDTAGIDPEDRPMVCSYTTVNKEVSRDSNTSRRTCSFVLHRKNIYLHDFYFFSGTCRHISELFEKPNENLADYQQHLVGSSVCTVSTG